ncbi:MAG: sulfotransferase [Pseudomonadota bacterium]
MDFIGIGAQKAGTTWLMHNLAQHPDVWTPFVKELHYFDVLHLHFPTANLLRHFRQTIGRLRSQSVDSRELAYLNSLLDKSLLFTDDWYRHVFSAAPEGRLRGEFTPHYCCLPDKGIQHLQKLTSGSRYLYLVRDPVDRATSSLRMAISRGLAEAQLDTCRSLPFRRRGDYAGNIPRWERLVGAENILYIRYGRLRRHPKAVLQEVESFLGLPHFSGYSALEQRVFRTTPHAIDQTALQTITDDAAHQRAFLRQHFGEDFVCELR